MALFGNQGSRGGGGGGGGDSVDDVRVEFGNQGSCGGGDDSVDDVRVEFGNQGSRGGVDDSVDDVRVESTPRRGCSRSSSDGENGGDSGVVGGDGENGGDSGVVGSDSGSAYSEDGVGSLGTNDDVCFLMKGDGMASPPSGNVFVDTAALSDQEHLQSALALFAKYPHIFKSNIDSGRPLSVAASHDSAKYVATCAAVASLEADDTAVLDLFDQHPFQPIAKEVAAANRFKQVVPPKKEEHAPASKSFMKKLGGLPSCYNKKCRLFTNCMCLKALEDYDVATDELWILAPMSKKEQEPLYKEWINARYHTSARLAQGYGLHIGPDKKRLVFCRNSFMNLLNLGPVRWSTLKTTKLVLGSNTQEH
jgi:hypothetical protein